MITWDDAQTLCQEWGNDKSSNMLTVFKLNLNIGYKEVLGMLINGETQQTKKTTLQDGERALLLAQDFITIDTVTVTVGGRTTEVREIGSYDVWKRLTETDRNADRPEFFHVHPRFGVRGAEILLDPIPDDATAELEIQYQATDRDLSQDAYTTGTIAVENGSATVTGTDTVFINAMIGRYLKITSANGDGEWYRIANVISGTEIQLENNYSGADASSLNYTINEIFALPEHMQILPVYFAMMTHFNSREKDKSAERYERLFDKGTELYRLRLNAKSTGNTIDMLPSENPMFPSVSPPNFPQSIIGS